MDRLGVWLSSRHISKVFHNIRISVKKCRLNRSLINLSRILMYHMGILKSTLFFSSGLHPLFVVFSSLYQDFRQPCWGKFERLAGATALCYDLGSIYRPRSALPIVISDHWLVSWACGGKVVEADELWSINEHCFIEELIVLNVVLDFFGSRRAQVACWRLVLCGHAPLVTKLLFYSIFLGLPGRLLCCLGVSSVPILCSTVCQCRLVLGTIARSLGMREKPGVSLNYQQLLA